MPNDAAVLGEVRAAFAQCEPPQHFTDYTHCEECAEHDELLQSRENETLRIADVGNPGWDPLCYVDASGFAYFFPGLARLALADPDPQYGWYTQQLLFQLTYQGVENRHLLGFDADQRRAVAALLRHIVETRSRLSDDWLCSNELRFASDLWSPGADPGAAPDTGRDASFWDFKAHLRGRAAEPSVHRQKHDTSRLTAQPF